MIMGITPQVEKCLRESGIREGLLLCKTKYIISGRCGEGRRKISSADLIATAIIGRGRKTDQIGICGDN